MSFVTVTPDNLTTAAGEVRDVDRTIRSLCAAPADLTRAVQPPGKDCASAGAVAFFVRHMQEHQKAMAELSEIFNDFADELQAAATRYSVAEEENAQYL